MSQQHKDLGGDQGEEMSQQHKDLGGDRGEEMSQQHKETSQQKASRLASNMDAFAGREQLTYGELAVREMETFIVIFTLEMVASADGRDRLTISEG